MDYLRNSRIFRSLGMTFRVLPSWYPIRHYSWRSTIFIILHQRLRVNLGSEIGGATVMSQPMRHWVGSALLSLDM